MPDDYKAITTGHAVEFAPQGFTHVRLRSGVGVLTQGDPNSDDPNYTQKATLLERDKDVSLNEVGGFTIHSLDSAGIEFITKEKSKNKSDSSKQSDSKQASSSQGSSSSSSSSSSSKGASSAGSKKSR